MEESRVHLHLHRAPISATQPTATRRTDLLRTDIRATRSPAMVTLATRDTPLTRLLRAMDTRATQDSPPTPPRVTDRQAIRDTPPTTDPRPLRRQAAQDSPLTPVLRAMVFRARRPILPTPVPVTEIPSPVIPAIALRRTGRLGPGTLSSLLAELRPRIHPQCLTPLAAGESERLRKIDCPCKGWALNLRSAPIGKTVSRGSALTPGPGGLASRGVGGCARACASRPLRNHAQHGGTKAVL